ncbi:YSIRK-type signal peptide-containing protein [Aerococcaceae bacterium NML201209]|nr:YSIRK-type signal peptide-containing protein [Aerococcaceae bacterium NML201209]
MQRKETAHPPLRRYSIRKTNIGVGSVLVGLFLGSCLVTNTQVQAEENAQPVFLLTSEEATNEIASDSMSEGNETSEEDNRSETAPVVEGIRDKWTFDNVAEHRVPSAENENVVAQLSGSSATVSTDDPVFGSSLQFGAHNDNKVTVPNYINTGTQNTSFAFWYNHDSNITLNAGSSTVLLQQSGQGRTLVARKPDGKLFTYINAREVTTQGRLADNKWQHVAVTFDQENRKGKFYINGQLDNEVNIGTNSVNATTDLIIGAHKNPNNSDPHPMRGKMDELHTFDKVLTPEEVRALYEDKAIPLSKYQLSIDLSAARTVLEGQTLANDTREAQALSEAINHANSLVGGEGRELAVIQQASERLTQAISEYRAASPISIHINGDQVERVVDAKSIFGINHRYAFNGYGSFDANTGKVKDEFKELYKQANFGSIRYPGGTISNLFNWKTAVGSPETRKKQIHGFYNNPGQGGIAPNFGPAELGTFTKEVGSEIVYVYSLARGNRQDVADLMEYLNAEVGTNPNGGIDWAAIRARDGHEKPFNVRYFEIGNEMQQGGTDGRTSQQYWTAFVPGKTAEEAYIEGGLAQFNKQYAVKEEDWNKEASVSDGSAHLVRYMRYANVNPGKLNADNQIVADSNFVAVESEGIAVFVGNDQTHEQWTRVDNFDNSTGDDKHYRVDLSTGAIIFGDGQKGKIPPTGAQIYASYRVQKDGFIEIAKSLKETMAQIDATENKTREANVYTGFESRGFIQRMAQKNAEQYYDGMTIHPYSGHVAGGNNAEVFYDNAMKKAEDVGIEHVRRYVEMLPEGKVPVISEFGIFRNTEPQLRSLTHALYIAKNVMEYIRLGSPYIQKHTLVDWYSSGADSLGPTQQAVIQAVAKEGANTVTGEGKFEFFSTPSAHVFEMLNKGFGNNVVELNIDSNEKLANGVTPLSGIASKDEEGNLYIAILNVDRNKERTLNLNINQDLAGRKVEVQTLTADSITAENSLTEPNKVAVMRSVISAEQLSALRITPHTFLVLKVLPKEETTPTQPRVHTHEDTKVTVEYAANEIAEATGVVVHVRTIQPEELLEEWQNKEVKLYAIGATNSENAMVDTTRPVKVSLVLDEGKEFDAIQYFTGEGIETLEHKKVDNTVQFTLADLNNRLEQNIIIVVYNSTSNGDGGTTTPDTPTPPTDGGTTTPDTPTPPTDSGTTTPDTPTPPTDGGTTTPDTPDTPTPPTDGGTTTPDTPGDDDTAEQPKVLAFKDEQTGIKVTFSADEPYTIHGLHAQKVTTPLASEPSVLKGREYDLYDLEALDDKGGHIDLQQGAKVSIPVPTAKEVDQVIFLQETGEAKAIAFARHGEYVEFTAPHFSMYAVLYAKAEETPKQEEQTPPKVEDTVPTEQPQAPEHGKDNMVKPSEEKPQTAQPKNEKLEGAVISTNQTTASSHTASSEQTPTSTLPKTGEYTEYTIFGAAALSILASVGLMPKHKREME